MKYRSRISFEVKSFQEPKNLAVITCRHVIRYKLPILYVSHDDDDGGWQFLCGINKHDLNDALTVSLEEIIKIDNTLLEMADLPIGCIATRNGINKEWVLKV